MSRAVQLVLLSVVILTCLQTGAALDEKPESDVDQISMKVLRNFLPYIRRDLTNIINEKVTSLRESLHEELMEYIKQTASDLQHTSLQSTCDTEQLCAKMDTLDSKMDTVDANVRAELSSIMGDLSSLDDSINEISDNVETYENHVTTELMELDQNLQQNFSLQLNNSYGYNYPVYTCGGTEGWRRVIYLDMTDPNTPCPDGWRLTSHSKRTCGGVSVGNGFDKWFKCDSVTFPVTGRDYSSVCGRIRGYQYGSTFAFSAYNSGPSSSSIEVAYVSGVSLTHGSPRQHIWTFASGVSEIIDPNFSYYCPCDGATNVNIPPFVGEDYFCESGHNSGPADSIYGTFYPDDPLWDGDGCSDSSTCCSFNNPPYFTKELPSPTSDDIEARLCHFFSDRDTPIEFMELYVK